YSLDPINLTGEDSEKPMEFDVVLEQVPAQNKIAIIKALRSLTGLSLRESKQMVDSAPTTINQSVDLQIAEATKIQLEAVGATVALK
ncbi:MAG: bL12 family ribosomal protein, partial [Spirulinaceae cyanobacterium]